MDLDPKYNDAEALAELRRLSPAARDFLRDRLMNPLAGCTNWLQIVPPKCPDCGLSITRALEGAWNVKKNFDEIFS